MVNFSGAAPASVFVTCAPLLLRDEELTEEYAGVFRSSVLMLSRVSLRPLLTELLSSQLERHTQKQL